MRTFTRSIIVLAGISSSAFAFTACEADCEEKGTCGPYSPEAGAAGDAGAPGTGGSSATGGSSGSSGTSGSSGVAGSSDAGGANAGEGGQAGGAGGTGAQGGANAGGSSGDGSITGGEGGEAGGTTTACDPTLAPEDDTCVIDEAYGVFVSPTGDNDEGDGSRANPFASFGKAIEIAAESGKRVYACEGEEPFAESVSIGAEASGLEIFGGFDCGDWTYGAVAKTSVVSPTPLALHIVDAENVRIEGVRFEAADGELPGESSVGAFVVNSTGVVLRRVEIVAGDGVDGADGELEEFVYPAKTLLDGNLESMGGGEKVCVCQGALMSVGGVGGTPSVLGQSGSAGFPQHGGGLGGIGGSACGADGTGDDGAAAPSAPPASGAITWGFVNAAGWQPTSGDNGGTGEPGQGGGGGASRNNQGHGGGGACGGCGGNGATKGTGGGASIAVLSFDSDLELDIVALVTNDAGNGGSGRPGQTGQQERGTGGGVVDFNNSCPGGGGGVGGDGGASGGGAGGLSIGVLWAGEQAPAQAEVTFEPGTPGHGGPGGEPGVNDGVDGIDQDTLEAT